MPFGPKNEGVVLASLLALFVCRAVLASAIVPPWQGPDEPTHFALAHLLAAEGVIPDSVEEQVLVSMAKYRWWEPYGARAPNPLPTVFRQIPRVSVGLYDQPLYYSLGAGVLRVTQPANVETSYWQLRALSVLLSIAALAFGWAGTRVLFGPVVAAGAGAMAALHPQFLLASISVNPDALLNVCGAFLWWQAARVVTGHQRAMSIMLLVTAAAAAPLIKRNAVPLVVIAVAMTVVSAMASVTSRFTRRDALLTVIGMVGGAGVLWAGWVAFPDRVAALERFWGYGLRIRRPTELTTFTTALDYARQGTDYAWLVAGWLRFSAPETWLWIVRGLTLAGFSSAALLLLRLPLMRRRLSVAWLFVIIQVATVLVWGFLTLASPQGRYLFPVIAPATALLWLGLTRCWPARVQPYAAPALVVLLAVLDLTAFSAVLMPAYVPWG